MPTDTARLRAINEELVSALEAIRDGSFPRPVKTPWRKDGAPSKHEQCAHNLYMWEVCDRCIEEHVNAALLKAGAKG